MTNTSIEFAIFDKYENNEDYEKNILKANKIWKYAFDRMYREDECPSKKIIIGCIDNKPVCCAIFDIYLSVSVISCVASNPQKLGYGTLLMEYIKDYLKKLDINRIHLNVDINNNSDRLIKFYSKFGFVKQDNYPFTNTDQCTYNPEFNIELDQFQLFAYDEDTEYKMICNY